MPDPTTTTDNGIRVNLLEVPLDQYSSNTPIKISILAGEGQLSYSVFRNINGELEGGSIINRLIGIKKDVKDKSITCISVVSDTNPENNRTSVNYYINDKKVKTLRYDVPDENGTLIYQTEIKFI